ncbi:hypothetical protein CY35_06G014300 [Sphagnum magellanicum]|nr:hypothetical protein CY35_06G014300 [Sphagnum magellanicum]
MSHRCTHYNALRFEHEKKRTTLCCGGGKMFGLNNVFPAPAQPLRDLLTSVPSEHQPLPPATKDFKQNIRACNSTLQMASTGLHIHSPEQGINMIAIKGALYIIDSMDAQVIARLAALGATGATLHQPILAGLQQMLHDHNTFVQRDGDKLVTGRDIRVRARGGRLWRISDLHLAYDPLHFVLFHPHVDAGPAQRAQSKKITARKWACYHMQDRNPALHALFVYGKRLYQEWVVDQYNKMESQRLFYIRNNQGPLRVAIYGGVVDAITNNDANINNLGRLIVLPSLFIGGHRHMAQLYQDSMAIWEEIISVLKPDEIANDRPDLVTLVVNIHVIEWQKKSLPHAHILLILHSDHKPRGLDEYDRMVVPYNPYLSLLFNCHINVEVCTSVADVKYLYKYVYKGHDHAEVDVAAPDGAAPAQSLMRDEIKIYQDSRYVSASEASHRLYGFDLHKEHPNVIRLAMHLKGRQTILFQEGTDVAAVFNRNPHTTLTAWFAFNKTTREHFNPSAPLRLALNTLYHDFPRITTWKKKEKQWALRTRTPGLLLVGHMYFVQPSEGERYFLRLLLHHMPGATSFEDLACTNRHLQHPTQHASFKEAWHCLLPCGFAWSWFACCSTLNARYVQRVVYDNVMAAVDRCAFFVDGPSGTSKTFLYNCLLSTVCAQGRVAVIVASSSIATLLLDGGLNNTFTCYISRDYELATLLQAAMLIVWDEAVMMHRHVLKAVNRYLQDIMAVINPTFKFLPFGDLVVVFGGDFQQILPVMPRGTRGDVVAAALNHSNIWQHVRVFKLHTNMCAFANYLQCVGEGAKRVYPSVGEDSILIPHDMCYNGPTVADLIKEVYGTLSSIVEYVARSAYIIERAILTPLNEDVDALNKLINDKYALTKHAGSPAQHRVYYNADCVVHGEQHGIYPIEFLNTLSFSGVPPHELHLQEGCPIVLLRNMTSGLANGTKLIVIQLMQHVIEGEVITGPTKGQRVFIPRLSITLLNTERMPFTLLRHQLPVHPAFAMTINKAQGQTLKMVDIFLPKPVFTHGQLYVTMSHIGCREGVKLLVPDGWKNDAHEDAPAGVYTRNVVYTEVL